MKRFTPRLKLDDQNSVCPPFGHFALHLVELRRPARGARHHRHACRPRPSVVAQRHLRRGEFDGHVGTAEGRRAEVLRVVHVYHGDNLMSPLAGNPLNEPAHLAVSYKSYFHMLNRYNRGNAESLESRNRYNRLIAETRKRGNAETLESRNRYNRLIAESLNRGTVIIA